MVPKVYDEQKNKEMNHIKMTSCRRERVNSRPKAKESRKEEKKKKSTSSRAEVAEMR